MDEYDEEALQADANGCWQPWSLQLEGLKNRLNELSYSRPQFSLAPGSSELFQVFGDVRTKLSTYLHDGEEVFEGVARALLDTAVEYMEMEGYAQTEIDTVEKEMAAL